VSFIRDTPYHTADAPWSFTTVRRNRSFRRYLLFFLVGYLAVSVGSPFLNPFLAQVHHQGYRALGIYSSLAALGAAVLTPAMGRVTDLYGPRAGIGGVLVFLFAGAALLVFGWHPALWGLAMLFCGAFDTSRFVATGIVGRSFGTMPTAWGFAIFDAIMGIPMAGGAVLGGLLYRQGYRLPFVLVMVLAALLVIVLVAAKGSFAQRPATDTPATD
jgi:predicted MFS family arabinose efflux permease